jgi:hypothetical protein
METVSSIIRGRKPQLFANVLPALQKPAPAHCDLLVRRNNQPLARLLVTECATGVFVFQVTIEEFASGGGIRGTVTQSLLPQHLKPLQHPGIRQVLAIRCLERSPKVSLGWVGLI